MAARNRSVTVLFSLIASMTVGALVLMALDNQRPITGALFSLSSYLRLDPAENAIKNTVVSSTGKWNEVHIYYSGTAGGTADELELLTDLATGERAQFHFAIGNGKGADDGAIQAGEFWQYQRLCQGRNGQIRICVISDGKTESVTDTQLNRTNSLVEGLTRQFGISSRNITYPPNWKM